jgi:hypothetical protein
MPREYSARSDVSRWASLVPTVHVMLEERLPRRVQAAAGEPVLQGDPA